MEPTDVRPFSNGSDADFWEARNCERCTKRGEYDALGVGPCPIETAISMGRLLRTIPATVARQAGATIHEQVDARGVGFCSMPRQCAEFSLFMTYYLSANAA